MFGSSMLWGAAGELDLWTFAFRFVLFVCDRNQRVLWLGVDAID